MNNVSQLRPLIKLAIMQKKKRASQKPTAKATAANALNINIGGPASAKAKGLPKGGIQKLLMQLLNNKGKAPHHHGPGKPGHTHGAPGKGMPGPAFMKGLKTGLAIANKMNGAQPNQGQQCPNGGGFIPGNGSGIPGKGPGMGFVKGYQKGFQNGFQSGFNTAQQLPGQTGTQGQALGQLPNQLPGQIPGLNIGINMQPGIAPQPQTQPNILGIGIMAPQASPIQFNQNLGGFNTNQQNVGYAF